LLARAALLSSASPVVEISRTSTEPPDPRTG